MRKINDWAACAMKGKKTLKRFPCNWDTSGWLIINQNLSRKIKMHNILFLKSCLLFSMSLSDAKTEFIDKISCFKCVYRLVVSLYLPLSVSFEFFNLREVFLWSWNPLDIGVNKAGNKTNLHPHKMILKIRFLGNFWRTNFLVGEKLPLWRAKLYLKRLWRT